MDFIYVYRNDGVDIGICGCGHIQRGKITNCEKCGCSKTRNKPWGGNSIDDVNFVTESKMGYLKSTRKTTKYTLDTESEKVEEKELGEYSLVLNFKGNEYYCVDTKGNKVEASEGRIRYFLKGYNVSFVKSIENETVKRLIDLIYDIYEVSLTSSIYRYINSNEFRYIEVLNNAGIPKRIIKQTTAISYLHRNGRCKRATTVLSGINTKATKPHEILGMNKTILRELLKNNIADTNLYFKLKSIDTNTFLTLINMVKMYGGEDLGRVLNSVEDIKELKEQFNYKLNDLIRYVVRDVKLSQGIMSVSEAIKLLRDLNKMARDIEVSLNEKYPKSLKRDHDISVMNYQAQESELNKKKFKEITSKESYKMWLYEDKDYTVTMPLEPSDLVKEGKGLHHCVASYIKDVISDKCKIYFIRRKENLKESLLTVEIRNEEIIQIKGFGNREPYKEEMVFIDRWTKNKKLKKEM